MCAWTTNGVRWLASLRTLAMIECQQNKQSNERVLVCWNTIKLKKKNEEKKKDVDLLEYIQVHVCSSIALTNDEYHQAACEKQSTWMFRRDTSPFAIHCVFKEQLDE